MFQRPRPGSFREDQLETAEMYLARERRLLFLKGPIMGVPGRWDQFSTTAVHDAILAFNVEDSSRPIYLVIDSPGGEVTEGWTLYDAIRMSLAEVVTVGQACGSMAAVLLAAGRRRLVYPHATVMLHLPWGAMQGDVEVVAIRAAQLRKARDRIVDAYLECGVTSSREQVLKDMDREFWLDATEAVAYGLADAVVDPNELFGR